MLLALPSLPAASFSYEGPVFDAFVQDSYRVAGKPSAWKEFYQTMDARGVKAGIGTWDSWVAGHHAKGTAEDAREAGEQVWKRVKKTITKFSLDRGFEFSNVVDTDERQCYLQSILVSGVLQKAGYQAGVAMVWSNPKGQTSNNGHAVAVVRTKGKDLVIDCSEPKPVEVHKGLFMRQAGTYVYLLPQYTDDGWITGYARPGIEGHVLPASQMTLLDLPFLKSQFDYYRGERAIGGVIAKDKTAEGLAASERFYRKSLDECSSNPLTRAMLARTLGLEGKMREAEAERQKVLTEYSAFGWTPDEVRKPVAAR